LTFFSIIILYLFYSLKAPPKGLPGSSEALETDANGKRKTSGRGGTAEQRREKLDHAIMAANPFNSDRLIRMYVSKLKKCKLCHYTSLYTYRQNYLYSFKIKN
jgi:hypothetical protein